MSDLLIVFIFGFIASGLLMLIGIPFPIALILIGVAWYFIAYKN
jgi:hypothetical protein|tara:strand:- start:335 stop:466 length:132 start_codon:yes stop_codon:yes gene_type:complete